METSLLLAKGWGIFLVVLSLAFIINKNTFQYLLKAADDKNFLMVTGLVSLVVGIVSVLIHNVWTYDWRGLITLFGWLTLGKGVVRLMLPSMVQQTVRKFRKSNLPQIALYIALGLGLYLLYVGFLTS